jgi:hypothetical protein
MVIRKLLASSSAAVSKTLQSLINKLEALQEGYDDNLEGDLSEDFEAYGEYSEEYTDEDETDDEAFNEERQRDRQEIIKEQELLKSIKALADSISHDAKGDDLLTALQAGFALAEESVMQVDGKRGARKAVIFTESTRTQQYVLGLLNEGGYKGQVVLLNGSNNDEISKRIYDEWKERHKGDGTITSSKAANMKAAIVEEFRDRATILIGTEAAAEGINLQFCNMVVKLRSAMESAACGTAHRSLPSLRQRYDVVVVNFVNQNNAADRGCMNSLKASSGCLRACLAHRMKYWERWSGVLTLNGRYTTSCRTAEPTPTSTASLTPCSSSTPTSSRSRKPRLFSRLWSSIDGTSTAKLKNCETRTRASLAKFDRWKFDLFAAYGATRVNDRDWTFDYKGKRYIPSWAEAKAGAQAHSLNLNRRYTRSCATPPPPLTCQQFGYALTIPLCPPRSRWDSLRTGTRG